MSTKHLPACLLALLALTLVACLAYAPAQLPEKVASHFNASGFPDGWMTRSAYVFSVATMGLGLPLFMIGLFYVTRFFPDWMINLPHKQFWLSPELRPHTDAWLLRHSLWFACLLVCLTGAMHFLTIQANRSVPVELPTSSFTVVMAGFLAGTAVWVVTLIRHFRKPT